MIWKIVDKLLIEGFDIIEKCSIFALAIKKDITSVILIYCGVEQLAARWAHNPKVIRSSRVPATKKSGLIFGFLTDTNKTIRYIAGWSSWQLVGLITQRSSVRVGSPLLKRELQRGSLFLLTIYTKALFRIRSEGGVVFHFHCDE